MGGAAEAVEAQHPRHALEGMGRPEQRADRSLDHMRWLGFLQGGKRLLGLLEQVLAFRPDIVEGLIQELAPDP